MAASMALPPRSRICTPARAASGWLAATMPYLVATFDRPTMTRGLTGVGSCPLTPMKLTTINATIARRTLMKSPEVGSSYVSEWDAVAPGHASDVTD